MRFIPSHSGEICYRLSSSGLSRERIPKPGELGSSVPQHRVTEYQWHVQPHPKGLKAPPNAQLREKYFIPIQSCSP